MWIVGVVGLLGAAIAGGLSFIPPAQIATGSPAIYIGLLLASTAIEVAIPFIIFAFHRKSWKAAELRFRAVRVADRRPRTQSSLEDCLSARHSPAMNANRIVALGVFFAGTAAHASLGANGRQRRGLAMVHRPASRALFRPFESRDFRDRTLRHFHWRHRGLRSQREPPIRAAQGCGTPTRRESSLSAAPGS